MSLTISLFILSIIWRFHVHLAQLSANYWSSDGRSIPQIRCLNFEIILSLYDPSLFGEIRPLMVGNAVELFLRALSYSSMFCRRWTIIATFKKVSVDLLISHGCQWKYNENTHMRWRGYGNAYGDANSETLGMYLGCLPSTTLDGHRNIFNLVGISRLASFLFTVYIFFFCYVVFILFCIWMEWNAIKSGCVKVVSTPTTPIFNASS